MKPDKVYLEHILQEIVFIQENTSALSYSVFLKDIVLQKAVIQSFSVIGEAANQISKEFQKQHPEIDWTGITGLRNRLVHQYFNINFVYMWEIIEGDIPVLYEQVEAILKML